MSEEYELLALLIASVMTRMIGLSQSGQQLVEALSAEAMAGDKTAKNTLHNPWNSSVPPSRRMPAIETRLEELGTRLEQVGPDFLAILLEKERLEKQRAYQEARKRRSGRGVTDGESGSVEAGFERIVRVLRDEGVSNRHGQRTSVATLTWAARLILGDTNDRWCDEIVSIQELSKAKVLQHVCVLQGWSFWTGEIYDYNELGELEHQDPVQGTWRTALPVPVPIDPPGIPRDWTPESTVEMHPVLWDTLPPDKYYRSFVRELEDAENLAFN